MLCDLFWNSKQQHFWIAERSNLKSENIEIHKTDKMEAIEHNTSLNSLLVDALPYIDHGYDEPGVREAVRFWFQISKYIYFFYSLSVLVQPLNSCPILSKNRKWTKLGNFVFVGQVDCTRFAII